MNVKTQIYTLNYLLALPTTEVQGVFSPTILVRMFILKEACKDSSVIYTNVGKCFERRFKELEV